MDDLNIQYAVFFYQLPLEYCFQKWQTNNTG